METKLETMDSRLHVLVGVESGATDLFLAIHNKAGGSFERATLGINQAKAMIDAMKAAVAQASRRKYGK